MKLSGLKAGIPFLITGILLSCTNAHNHQASKELNTSFTMYSTNVGDTFHIGIQLPEAYYDTPTVPYPIVVLLDANFFAPMLGPVLNQYEKTGLLKPVILVSIGYESFQAMDSLRVRDYLYPQAIPSDEMEAIGGGLMFNTFITQELLPRIDSGYRTDTQSRTLMGHSFGGYFVLYSLLTQLEQHTQTFKNFITASPTLWYNDFYLNQLPAQLKRAPATGANIFLTVGGMEDSTWSLKPVRDMAMAIHDASPANIKLVDRIYNHLDHMDVGMLSFTKGLQQFLNDDKP